MGRRGRGCRRRACTNWPLASDTYISTGGPDVPVAAARRGRGGECRPLVRGGTEAAEDGRTLVTKITVSDVSVHSEECVIYPSRPSRAILSRKVKAMMD